MVKKFDELVDKLDDNMSDDLNANNVPFLSSKIECLERLAAKYREQTTSILREMCGIKEDYYTDGKDVYKVLSATIYADPAVSWGIKVLFKKYIVENSTIVGIEEVTQKMWINPNALYECANLTELPKEQLEKYL